MLTAETLRDTLTQFPAATSIKSWYLAYSGGVDSQVLLHLMAQTGLSLKAVYIDHGLQRESGSWADHCRQSCEALAVPFQSITVNARPEPGESPEAAARKARYRALAEIIKAEDCLLTAQHQDDQAETFLLQLFRGAGAAGLASMPAITEFSLGWHARPLLAVGRREILQYAQSQGLSWVEDPSNLQQRYDRNYLRLQLLPQIKQRWPSINQTLAQAAEQQAENKRLLEQLAEQDADKLSASGDELTVAGLLGLSQERQRNLLRYWLKRRDLAIPSRQVLKQILQQMLYSPADAQPEVQWAGCEMHRYKGRLYAFNRLDHDSKQSLPWSIDDSLSIASIEQTLVMKTHTGLGLDPQKLPAELQVRFRQGGEKFCPAGRHGHHSLKKLFQEAEVPPWMRDRIPLIYSSDELIAVAGYWVADEYKVDDEQAGLFPELEAFD